MIEGTTELRWIMKRPTVDDGTLRHQPIPRVLQFRTVIPTLAGIDWSDWEDVPLIIE